MVRLKKQDRLVRYQPYKGKLALNVKVRTYKLPTTTQERLSKFPEKQRDKIIREAEENAREEWWAWAQDHASELDLGILYSGGRSGGWMMFNGYRSSDPEEWVYQYERECDNCGMAYEEHAEEKCLFDSTNFVAVDSWGVDHTMVILENFADDILESLTTVGEMVGYHAERCMDDVFDEQAVQGG